MRTVAITSVKGAPGVTTTALLLASMLERSVVVEADLDGSSLAIRYGLGREPGLTTLAAATSGEAHIWRDHAQDAGGVAVLVGPDSAATARSLWNTAGDAITARLAATDTIAVVDSGRFRTPTPILRAADIVLVAVTPVADQLVALNHQLPVLRAEVRGVVEVLLIGAGPYSSSDVETALDVEVIAYLPDDRAAADALRIGGIRSRLGRSRLARATRDLATHIEARLTNEERAAS
jgi:MinD-like ATPase involved in chromosome partitioning or flagellar assembly